jgi:predicted DNA-binding protein with PD1-like motif
VIVGESSRGRRLVGRIDRGADLAGALLDLAASRAVRAAEVRASGALEELELRWFDQRARAWRPRKLFDPVQLVQLHGTIAERPERGGRPILDAYVLVSTAPSERDSGVILHGGQLVRARVYSVEFVVDSFDDLTLRRAPDRSLGLDVLRLAAPVGTAEEVVEAPAAIAPAVAEAPSWADVARASAGGTVEQEPVEDLTEDPVGAGDVIEHPRFGRCVVERIEGDAEFAQVRLRNMRLIRLSLDVLTLVRDGAEPDGARRFRAEVRR